MDCGWAKNPEEQRARSSSLGGAAAWDGSSDGRGAPGGRDLGDFGWVGFAAGSLARGGVGSAAALGAGGEDGRDMDDLSACEYGDGCCGGGAGAISGAVCGPIHDGGAAAGGMAGARADGARWVECFGGARTVADPAMETGLIDGYRPRDGKDDRGRVVPIG